MKAVVAAFNQEKALVGAFSVITNLRMELFEALVLCHVSLLTCVGSVTSLVTWPGPGQSPVSLGSVVSRLELTQHRHTSTQSTTPHSCSDRISVRMSWT